jgi:hypothetical protein
VSAPKTVEEQIKQLAAVTANLMTALEMQGRTMREVTRILTAFDQRLAALENRDRKAVRKGLILPDTHVAGHG